MRIEQITFTRFLAAISIVIFHYGKDIFPFNNTSVSFLFDQANIGVSYFFILSGFVMIIAYYQRAKINFFEYMKTRFARIYPAYLGAIIILFVYQIKTNSFVDYSGLVLNVLALQAWIPGKALSFNTPGWSLSIEFFFYAIFPFLFNTLYKNKEGLKKTAVAVLIIWLVSQVFLHWFTGSDFYQVYPSKSHEFIYYFPLMHLNEFLIGNLAGLLFVKKYKDKSGNFDVLILVLVIALILALKFPIGFNFHNGMLSFIFVPLIFFISANKGILTAIFKSKPLVFLGEISYGIYILQLPIFLWTNKIFERLYIDNPSIKFYLFLALLIIISAISYILVETPLRNKIRNFPLTKQPVIHA